MNRTIGISEAQLSGQAPASRFTKDERLWRTLELDLELKAPEKKVSGFHFKLYYKVTDIGELFVFIWS